MKTTHRFPLFAIPLALLAGCGAELPAEESAAEEGERQALAVGFTWDTASLTAIPAGSIPSTRLTLSAYDAAGVQQRLIQSAEQFSEIQNAAGRVEMDSASFTFSTDKGRGLVLALSKLAEGAPANPSESELQSSAVARVKTWGIGASEIGPVWQRRLMGAGEDNGARTMPAVASYKTFINRAILGVRVDGHRAVVTHGLVAGFRRVIARWPALAPSGHLLHTKLTTTQIKSRATTALNSAGYTSGKIKLRWKYLATAAQSGEVTLKLMVGARTAAVSADDVVEEPHEIDVDVSAVQ